MKTRLMDHVIARGIFLFGAAGLILLFGSGAENSSSRGPSDDVGQTSECRVTPIPYEHALRNPLKGFTTRGIADHPWATTAQTYIRWNELENNESDGIDKIKKVCNEKWKGIEGKNVKVIPRVYLHWSGNRKYWPDDMQADDYTSEQFQERVLRLIERLGRMLG